MKSAGNQTFEIQIEFQPAAAAPVHLTRRLVIPHIIFVEEPWVLANRRSYQFHELFDVGLHDVVVVVADLTVLTGWTVWTV